MNSALRLQIQSLCDDVHRDPDDTVAFGRLRRLLGADAANGVGVVSEQSWRRLVKIASDQLYDAPEDRDSRDLLLLLLAARESAKLV